jgi:hypothetical protein
MANQCLFYQNKNGDKMGKIKGWKKNIDRKNALGRSESWINSFNGKIIDLYGSIGQYGSRQSTLDIHTGSNKRSELKKSSSDRVLLKNKAINYMKKNTGKSIYGKIIRELLSRGLISRSTLRQVKKGLSNDKEVVEELINAGFITNQDIKKLA